MIRRKSTLLSLVSLLLAFMLITAYMYLTYLLYFDSVSDDFTGLSVMTVPLASESGQYFERSTEQPEDTLEPMRAELDSWAAENKAVMFYRGGNAAGIAAIDYAGWFKKNFNADFNGQVPETVIVRKADKHTTTYIQDGYLFPGVYNYKIIGEFGEENLPVFQLDSFFYYPLQDISDMDGVLFTNIVEEKPLMDLFRIIENREDKFSSRR